MHVLPGRHLEVIRSLRQRKAGSKFAPLGRAEWLTGLYCAVVLMASNAEANVFVQIETLLQRRLADQ